MSADVIPLPVRKSVLVDAPVEDAFEVFTEDVDSWWPRTHHIGKTAMTRIVFEGREGGRCYSEHVDGTVHDFGQVTGWDPPRRFQFVWQMTDKFAYEPDLSRCSEVEVRFAPQRGRQTLVEVEHRFFERHGTGAAGVHSAVSAPTGWQQVMSLFAARLNERP